ncbi:MAG: RNA polymerase sigma factor [Phycisphaerae bacterium]
MNGRFDGAWRTRALAGEATAVRELAEATIAPLFRFCFYRVGGDHHLCEEAVQETLLKAIDRLPSYQPTRGDGEVFPWLTGLARNEIRRILNREKRTAGLAEFWRRMDEQLLSLYAMLETEPFGDDLLVRAETRTMVNATMSQLPLRYSHALEEKYVRGRTLRQIAAAAGTTEKAAESLLARARQAFRSTFLALAGNLPLQSDFDRFGEVTP